jgi:hypothetical protein
MLSTVYPRNALAVEESGRREPCLRPQPARLPQISRRSNRPCCEVSRKFGNRLGPPVAAPQPAVEALESDARAVPESNGYWDPLGR